MKPYAITELVKVISSDDGLLPLAMFLQKGMSIDENNDILLLVQPRPDIGLSVLMAVGDEMMSACAHKLARHVSSS